MDARKDHKGEAPSAMFPIGFSGCFGWIHPSWGDVGVVICSGTGQEKRAAHRSLLMLADQLAQAGYPTLRFDYPGTGDSSDAPSDGLVAAWRDSLPAAIDVLKGAAGVRRVVLCGLRLGATLAGCVSRMRGDVEGLILLAPVVSGRTYLRELQLESFAGDGAPNPSEKSLEAYDFTLSEADQSFLRTLNLLEEPLNVAHVLVMGSAPFITGLVQHLTGNGVATQRASFDDYAGMMKLMEEAVPLGPSLKRVVDWIGKTFPPRRCGDAASVTCPSDYPTAATWRETPLRFGPGGTLFGVLCVPADRAGSLGPAVAIGNTGVGPHYGLGRLHVDLARRLASRGVATLRFDFVGLGDSGAAAQNTPISIYEVDRSSDLRAAIDALQTVGYRRVSLLGNCSGAFHALHATLADPRIDRVVLINIALFTWKRGDSLATLIRHTPREMTYYVGRASKGDLLLRLLRGQIDVQGNIAKIRRSVMRKLSILLGEVSGRLGIRTSASFPRRAMRSLSRRGVRSLFILGADDPWLSVIKANFGAQGEWLKRLPGTDVVFLLGVDHSLTRQAMRSAVVSWAVAHLCADEVICGDGRTGHVNRRPSVQSVPGVSAGLGETLDKAFGTIVPPKA